ncbi:hypothetical protein TcCL_Unassigned01250 [Trypanosoma cruzi]|nr:hypothetical protein TcCL_Unassigned01250 [Trypanosoma cruzi]
MRACVVARWSGGRRRVPAPHAPTCVFWCGQAMGSRCDPMSAGVSVTAVLRAGTRTLAAAFHADGPLLCFIIIHFCCGGMAGAESGRQNCPAVTSLPSLLVWGPAPRDPPRPTREAS